jgi:endonuclease/exonuclease/phosphatase family metal-dependent hydrolase
VENPSISRTVETSDVTVITWNTHVGAGDVAALVAWFSRRARTSEPAHELVLLLQESVRRGPDVPRAVPPAAAFAGRIGGSFPSARDVLATARELGLNVAYVPSMRNGREQEDRGNAVLSTLRIVSVDAIELPFAHQRRVAVAATLACGSSGELMRVVDAHFDTALHFGAGGPAAWRRRQARALMSEIASADMPTIVAGDFNTWWGADEPAIRELRRAFPDVRDRVRRATWAGPLGASARLDFIFAGGWDEQVEVRRVPARFGSDHYPLYVEISGDRTPAKRRSGCSRS